MGDVPLSLNDVVGVPGHVVFRDFPAQTAVLNIRTGRYHGLDPVGGMMLRTLQEKASVRASLEALLTAFPDVDPDRIETDLLDLCAKLLDRGLIERRP